MNSPLAGMTQGMSEEDRKEFVESWRNATWLCDPIRKVLTSKRDALSQELVYMNGAETMSDEDLKAEIRAIDFFLRLIP